MTLVEDDDGGPEALVAACAKAGFSPSLRYRITDRKMHYDLIAAGRAISLSQPTAPAAEGTVMRPLVGAPVTGRIRLAWSRCAVSASTRRSCSTAPRPARMWPMSATTRSTRSGGTPTRRCIRRWSERTGVAISPGDGR